MSPNTPGQQLLVQLEAARHRLLASFCKVPCHFFTGSDALPARQTWVATRPADDLAAGRLHRESPPLFRLDGRDPAQRQAPPCGRGHDDLVVLDPAVTPNRRERDRPLPVEPGTRARGERFETRSCPAW
jgi:hypothetical protein